MKPKANPRESATGGETRLLAATASPRRKAAFEIMLTGAGLADDPAEEEKKPKSLDLQRGSRRAQVERPPQPGNLRGRALAK